jgi:hypothetical protein
MPEPNHLVRLERSVVTLLACDFLGLPEMRFGAGPVGHVAVLAIHQRAGVVRVSGNEFRLIVAGVAQRRQRRALQSPCTGLHRMAGIACNISWRMCFERRPSVMFFAREEPDRSFALPGFETQLVHALRSLHFREEYAISGRRGGNRLSVQQQLRRSFCTGDHANRARSNHALIHRRQDFLSPADERK